MKHRIALDTNCFIDAVNRHAHAYEAMRQILDAYKEGLVKLSVSLQTLHELEARPDAALDMANQIERLPHYSIGFWDEQVGSSEDEAGTWADGKGDDERQEQIARLAKSGNDIRDRGALIDALRAECDFFVTSDGQLVKSRPRQQLEASFPIRLLTPVQFAEECIS